MDNFSKVSLGFAEFVSTLLEETFDATLSAQNHQIEKYHQIEKSLSLSNERFKDIYITEEMILEKEQELFGFVLKSQMIVNENYFEKIKSITGNQENVVYRKRLTHLGFSTLKEKIIELLISEKKEMLKTLIDANRATNLIVDSGEIKAKLELSNLSQNSNINISKRRVQRDNNFKLKQIDFKASDALLSSDFKIKGVLMKEIVNENTKHKTLIIDKESITDKAIVTNRIPNVRIVATPVSSTVSSNIFSEVTIKFKSI